MAKYASSFLSPLVTRHHHEYQPYFIIGRDLEIDRLTFTRMNYMRTDRISSTKDRPKVIFSVVFLMKTLDLNCQMKFRLLNRNIDSYCLDIFLDPPQSSSKSLSEY